MHSATPPSRPAQVAAAPHRRHRYRPTLERCEGRALMTTFTVTALTDTGAGQGTAGDLRYCISRADADGQRDTINFAVAGSIQLGGPLPAINSARGITIAGPGAGSLTVLGGGVTSDFTMLRVRAGASATIADVTFANGHTTRLGGAIFNAGRLVVAGATFANNSALTNGGAIDNIGTLTVANSTFVGNEASVSGGGIFSLGVVSVDGSTLSSNQAGSSGGAIESTFGLTRIATSTLDDNAAGFFGGAISINGPRDPDLRSGTLDLRSSTLSGNTAGRPVDGGGFGGAISSNDSVVAIDGTTFTANSSGRGAGGVGINGGHLTVAHSTFTANTTVGSGGGIFINGGRSITGLNVTDGATLNLTSSTFANNTAERTGGGIVSTSSTLKIAGATFTGNTAALFGGGIALDGDPTYVDIHQSLTLANSTFTGNTAGRGGAISNFDRLVLDNVTITGNLAGTAGGGIYNGRILNVGRSTIGQNRPDNIAPAAS